MSRNRTFLCWRFGADYRLFLARDSQTPVGCAAARIVTRAGVRVGMVVDCVADSNRSHLVHLLTSAVAWLKGRGVAAVLGYFLPESDVWRSARDAGFLRLPPALAPRDYPVRGPASRRQKQNRHAECICLAHQPRR